MLNRNTIQIQIRLDKYLKDFYDVVGKAINCEEIRRIFIFYLPVNLQKLTPLDQ